MSTRYRKTFPKKTMLKTYHLSCILPDIVARALNLSGIAPDDGQQPSTSAASASQPDHGDSPRAGPPSSNYTYYYNVGTQTPYAGDWEDGAQNISANSTSSTESQLSLPSLPPLCPSELDELSPQYLLSPGDFVSSASQSQATVSTQRAGSESSLSTIRTSTPEPTPSTSNRASPHNPMSSPPSFHISDVRQMGEEEWDNLETLPDTDSDMDQ